MIYEKAIITNAEKKSMSPSQNKKFINCSLQ